MRLCPPREALRRTLLDAALTGVFALLWMLSAHTMADPDLWGHLRFGSDLLSAHRFTSQDTYSFTADKVWVNHEWLAEVISAAAYRLAGPLGLNLLKLCVMALIGVMVWRVSRRQGAGHFSSGILTLIVLLATYTRTLLLRPQLFSVLFFCLLLVTMLRVEAGEREPWPLIPALFCVWANMHGGWIVGFTVLTVWTAFAVIESHRFATRARRVAILVAALAATLINPYGVRLWVFLRETVGLSRPYIADWKPLLTLPPGILAFEMALPILTVIAAVFRRRLPPLRHVAIVGMLAYATYRINRIDAFLQLALAVLLAPITSEWLNTLETRLGRVPRLTRRSYVHGAVVAAFLAMAVVVSARHLGKIYVTGDWRPDSEAARFVRETSPNSRLLIWFDWGEYAIWHLSPVGVQVSMDGRRETVYSERVIQDHFAFYDNEPDAWQYPATIGANRIWIPKTLPILPTLETRGWHVIYESKRSVVLAPGLYDSPDGQITSRAEPEGTLFPGPSDK